MDKEISMEELLKHITNYYSVYAKLSDGPQGLDEIKDALMREDGKPESTARSYIAAIRGGNRGLLMADEGNGTLYFDKELVKKFEDNLQSLFHWEEYDWRHEEQEELKREASEALEKIFLANEKLEEEVARWRKQYNCDLGVFIKDLLATKDELKLTKQQLLETKELLDDRSRRLGKVLRWNIFRSLIYRIGYRLFRLEARLQKEGL